MPGIGAGGVWGPCAHGVGAAGALPGWHGEGVVAGLGAVPYERGDAPLAVGSLCRHPWEGGVLGAAFSLGHPGASPRCPPGCAAMSLPQGESSCLGSGWGRGWGLFTPFFPRARRGAGAELLRGTWQVLPWRSRRMERARFAAGAHPSVKPSRCQSRLLLAGCFCKAPGPLARGLGPPPRCEHSTDAS